MAIESAIFYLVAVALPVWLVAEQLMHRGRPRPIRAGRTSVAPPAGVPASRPA